MASSKGGSEKGERKKRHRSPAYPAIGLKDAIEKLDKIYKADGRAGSPKKAALGHMGFSTAHGQALTVLAALKKFGLAEEAEGRISLTQRGLNILARQEGDPRREEAIKAAAQEPDIYRQLMEDHPNGLPSDASLKAELITDKGFNPNAVDGFIKDFRDTLKFAGLSDGGVLESSVEDEMPAMQDSVALEMKGQSQGQQKTVLRVFSWPLSKGVTAEVRLSGEEIRPAHLEMLRKYLELAESGWEAEE